MAEREHRMSESLTYQDVKAPARDQAHTLFGQTMGYVAATVGLCALGAWLGRSLPGGTGIAALACLIGMQFATRRSQQLTVELLAAFGLVVGLAFAPVLAAYASMDPQRLWQAGGAITLFIAAFGAAGSATRRNLTAIARMSFWALLALIASSVVLIFVTVPGGALICSVLSLLVSPGSPWSTFSGYAAPRTSARHPCWQHRSSTHTECVSVFLQIFSREE